MKKYLIVGNGVAGTTAAENIRKLDSSGSITIITDEPIPFYNRIRLNDFIADGLDEQGLLEKDESWYEERQIALITSTKIISADATQRIVTAEDNTQFQYDTLLLATGSHSFLPPINGSDKPGVFTLRNITDARAIKEYLAQVNEVILIGGGLLGFETGNAFQKRGKKIQIVEFFPRLLPRQLDDEGGQRLQKLMEERGFSFHLSTSAKEIKGAEKAEGLILQDESELSGQMIIVSAGVRANLELAPLLGIEADKGIKVDEYLRSSIPEIYAAGDVAEFNGPPYGIWPAGFQQGKVAGMNMAGGEQRYSGTSPSTILKVAGIDLASAGNIDAEAQYESEVLKSETIYKKIVLDKGIIIGCIMLGDTKDFNTITKYMSEQKDVSNLRKTLLS